MLLSSSSRSTLQWDQGRKTIAGTCQVKDEQHRRSPLDLPELELKDEQIRLSFYAWVQGRTDEHHSRYSLEAEYTGKHGGIQRDTKTSNLRLTRLIWVGRRCCCAWASRDLRSKLPMMHVKIASFFASMHSYWRLTLHTAVEPAVRAAVKI